VNFFFTTRAQHEKISSWFSLVLLLGTHRIFHVVKTVLNWLDVASFRWRKKNTMKKNFDFIMVFLLPARLVWTSRRPSVFLGEERRKNKRKFPHAGAHGEKKGLRSSIFMHIRPRRAQLI